MKNTYEWKIKSFFKGINPNDAIQEIEKIENIYGAITAENILKIAKNEDSVLHNLFEWNNTKAAEKYRLSQARTIINNIEIKIISDGESMNIPVYEVIKINKKCQYKHIETININEAEQIKNNIVRAINELKNKLKIYNKFNTVIKYFDLALNELNNN